MKQLRPFVSLLLVLHAATTSAGTWECGERSNLPIEGKNYCATGDFRQIESDLAALFNKITQDYTIRFGNTVELEKSQLAFLRYRDNHCIATSKRVADKPFYPMMIAQCKSRMSNSRIKELQQMLDNLKP